VASKLERDISAAIEAATRAGAGGPMDDFLARLAEKVGAQANVNAVFGEPIEREGIVVVPVAKVRWGFGGGAGSRPVPAAALAGAATDGAAGEPGIDDGAAAAGSGQGGGGGVTADPIGWLEIGPDGAEFKPIVPAMPSPAFMLAATFGASMLIRALARLLRR
jgi:uncharacterized spore protein YtfJ